MTTRFRLLVFLLTGLALAQPPTAMAQTPARTKVRVASVVSAAWLPLWIAKDKGMFTAHGLDVDITTVQNVSTVVGALGRQFEVSGCTPIDIIKARLRKLDVVGIAGNTQELTANQQMQLVTRADGPIQNLADLKGQVVATPSLNGVIHIATLNALRQRGVDPKDVRFQEMAFANMGDQLAAGRVAAAEIVEPYASVSMKVGVRTLGNPMLGVADPVILTCWMANGQWARDHRAAVTAWRAALNDAIQYIQKNDQASRAVLAKWTRLPDAVAGSVRLPAYTTRLGDAEIDTWIQTSFAVGAIHEKVSAAGASLN
ncbi:NMT1/THI5 like [Cupriavidus sp. OV038]|jgi:ABC-type nitrate/sulfonate/bicarbonate transport system substrate-binding protein|uniref:ABC transporter substrate-binding protein n=1 Tax=unclassified Cupriavidus TaxID=2640874 RepID=UPI0008ED9E6B|nr:MULTISPECIES: ABC transporter substrate-binding protein [unclassified Cupriavidus]SFC43083.1 NMT1/THI5 like [Cupriavidus sp. OV038]SFP32053.1 NMT1/THI5 like [Cupriavidus sp. OV096]